jgi:hypothetical protein
MDHQRVKQAALSEHMALPCRPDGSAGVARPPGLRLRLADGPSRMDGMWAALTGWVPREATMDTRPYAWVPHCGTNWESRL